MYDAIVAGAGPAGSMAAATLALAGRHVLLMDRTAFPRDKTCGDAVQAQGIKLLRKIGYQKPLDPAHFHPVHSWSVESPSRVSISTTMNIEFRNEPHIARRINFDQLVYEQAIANGAEFCQAQVSEPIIENGRIVGVQAKVKNDSMELRAPVVIAADGATSVIARKLLPNRSDVHWAISIRCYAKMNEDLHNHCEFFFPEEILPGYGWVFPTAEREANLGVGIRLDKYRARNIPLKTLMDRFLDLLGTRVDRDSITEMKSWQIPFGSEFYGRAFDGCMLVGDAGSFVDPLLGAGIYYGMLTGHLAAQVADAALREGNMSRKRLSEFDRLWRRAIGWPLLRATLVQKLVLAHPRVIDNVVNLAVSNKTIERTVAYLLAH